MSTFNVEILEVLGILSTNRDGWNKELTYTKWNGRAPKFDMRGWDPEHMGMTKGLTLTKEELMQLKRILDEIDFDKY